MKLKTIMFITALLLCPASVTTGQTHDGQIELLSWSFSVTNTFIGESICVTKSSVCQNETWILRLQPVDGKEDRFMLFADRLDKGKRVPLFVEQVQYNKQAGTLTKVGTGKLILPRVPAYSIVVDRRPGISGTFSSPDGKIIRRIKLKPVDPKQLPVAPSPDAYSGVWYLRNTNTPGGP